MRVQRGARAPDGMRLRAYRNARPTAVSVSASPALNATTSTRPNAVLLSATAASSSTIADGHGTRPPDTPSASRLRHVTLSARRRVRVPRAAVRMPAGGCVRVLQAARHEAATRRRHRAEAVRRPAQRLARSGPSLDREHDAHAEHDEARREAEDREDALRHDVRRREQRREAEREHAERVRDGDGEAEERRVPRASRASR